MKSVTLTFRVSPETLKIVRGIYRLEKQRNRKLTHDEFVNALLERAYPKF